MTLKMGDYKFKAEINHLFSCPITHFQLLWKRSSGSRCTKHDFNVSGLVVTFLLQIIRQLVNKWIKNFANCFFFFEGRLSKSPASIHKQTTSFVCPNWMNNLTAMNNPVVSKRTWWMIRPFLCLALKLSWTQTPSIYLLVKTRIM